MRVVFDGQPLLSPLVGIGHYTYELIRALARLDPGNELVVLYPHPVSPFAGHPPPAFTEPAVTIARPGWPRTVAVRVRRRLGLDVPLENLAGRADVFHGTNYLLPYATRRARRVVTIHDLTLLLFPEWHPAARLREMVPLLGGSVETADHIVVDSLATKRDLVKQLSVAPERVTVVPLAASAAFRPLTKDAVEPVLRRHGLASGAYFLFVGTLEPRKNLRRLFEALEIVDSGVGPLVVAGADGWRNDDVRERIRALTSRGRLCYLGYIPDADRPALMRGARFFVYPSLYEGFGLPPLEAMQCGTPVISADVSSLPEVVGEAALLVDPYDVDALAAAIRRLWHDGELRAALSGKGVAQAARFSWQQTARMTLEVYRRIHGS